MIGKKFYIFGELLNIVRLAFVEYVLKVLFNKQYK